MFADRSLAGKTAVVTGAGRGIGKAIALALAGAGADIVAVARTMPGIQATAEEVELTGRQAKAVCADVTNSSEVSAMVDEAIAKFGAVDILVNNVGQFFKAPLVPLPGMGPGLPKELPESNSPMTDEDWHRVIDVNLTSVFYCCRAVAQHMISKRYGKIISISSNNAAQAFPFVAAYNASKAAVNMLTRVLALEWADYDICVNAIAPGDYHTPSSDYIWSDPVMSRRRLDQIPLHRCGDLRELGLLAVYLAAPASDYITGQIIHIDGGLTAR